VDGRTGRDVDVTEDVTRLSISTSYKAVISPAPVATRCGAWPRRRPLRKHRTSAYLDAAKVTCARSCRLVAASSASTTHSALEYNWPYYEAARQCELLRPRRQSEAPASSSTPTRHRGLPARWAFQGRVVTTLYVPNQCQIPADVDENPCDSRSTIQATATSIRPPGASIRRRPFPGSRRLATTAPAFTDGSWVPGQAQSSS